MGCLPGKEKVPSEEPARSGGGFSDSRESCETDQLLGSEEQPRRHTGASTSQSNTFRLNSSSGRGSPVVASTELSRSTGPKLVASTQSTGDAQSPPGSSLTSAKPLGQFRYLSKEYGLETPSCLVPRVNELFKSVSERYDIAVTNREKIDQALLLFKRVLEQDRDVPLAECFAAWRIYLSNPTFTVNYREPSGDVKEITVRAEEIPRSRRKAQKHLRDLLDACNLFLQQRDFLQQHIRSDVMELERLAKELPALAKEARLSSSEKKQLPRTVRRAQEQFATFPRTIDEFWSQVYSLMHEINTSVYVLLEEA